MSVLLVEDDPLIREFVVEALREAGYHVIHASNGEEALAWCRHHVADVLVTDVKLPGKVDGWQIAERYREQDPELPVIYATGFSPSTPRPVPSSRIVRKPFHPDEIVRPSGSSAKSGERRQVSCSMRDRPAAVSLIHPFGRPNSSTARPEMSEGSFRPI